MGQKSKVGGSNKKKGRNLGKCLFYKQRNVRLTNKRRKLEKHLKVNPNDVVATNALKKA